MSTFSISAVQPYLFFNGRCDEAAEFYVKALGAEVVFKMRFKEGPEPYPSHLPPGSEEKIMHMTLQIGAATVMLSDGMCGGEPKFEGFSLSLTLPDVAQADQIFAALSEGGSVEMPMSKTFWSPYFGMVTDKFDVGWMISVAA